MTPPTRKDIAEWSLSSTQDLPAQIVWNAWPHGLYSYFPSPPDHAATAVVANDTNVNEEEESTDDKVTQAKAPTTTKAAMMTITRWGSQSPFFLLLLAMVRTRARMKKTSAAAMMMMTRWGSQSPFFCLPW